MPHDDLDHIPSIVPTRDTEPHYAGRQARGAKSAPGRAKAKRGGSSSSGGSGGAGIWVRLFLTVSLVVAAIACAWAWQLQEQLEQSEHLMSRTERRISDLEDRLADTDEGLSQNTASMAVKIKDSELEIRKLWDDRKKSNPKIDRLAVKTSANEKKVASVQKSLGTTQAQLKAASSDLSKLKSVAGDLSRLMTSAKANQSEVERVADDLNRINLEFAKVGKQVKDNGEWLSSINAFRSQVNSALTRMQADIRTLQTTP
jgi:chromosome segregation ATPase